MPVIVTPLAPSARAVEVVERKGVGHPDTICDALAEQLSRDLCAAYRARFGAILHHNVDKALLVGGRSAAAFGGGGRVEEPIDIYLAGRATMEVGGETVPVWDIAQGGARRWLRDNLHALDADAHVRIRPVIRPGSQDLQDVFSPDAGGGAPRANDTAFGVGYAPLSPLEQLVLAVDGAILGEIRAGRRVAWGEDVKVMGVRIGRDVRLTISCAMIGAGLADIDAYLEETAAVAALARRTAEPFGFETCAVVVNAADLPDAGEVYLTVTGTSAEAGDDGQVGRGNRINGLITPGRPMTLEAAAGKNPVSHVGKIYNVAAQDIARRVVAAFQDVARAECLLVGRIGAPIDQPAVAEIGILARDGAAAPDHDREIAGIVGDALAELPERAEALARGQVALF